MSVKWSADEIWADGEPKVCKLVIIGENLDHGLVLLQDFGDARMRETVDAAPESVMPEHDKDKTVNT